MGVEVIFETVTKGADALTALGCSGNRHDDAAR